MTPLPTLSGLQRSADRLTVDLDLSIGSESFEGHFPDTPVLPAVAQVDWAIRIARAHFSLAPRFGALRSLKFLRIVQPPVRLTLELTAAADGRQVNFSYSHGGAACSTGRIEFTDDAARPDRPFL